MYRFRTIDNLLGKHQELENQEIYFASPEELNDPMEGYKDIFWNGDKIVWANFLKNYIRCLEYIYALTYIVNNNRKLTESDIPILPNSNIIYASSKREILKQLYSNFLNRKEIVELPVALAKRKNPIRRQELLSYLKLIHNDALNSISDVLYENKIISKKFFTSSSNDFRELRVGSMNFVDLTNQIETNDQNNKNITENLFFVANIVGNEVDLITKYNLSKKELDSNKFFLISEFPEAFMSSLESFIYPKWYSASFISDSSNAAIWGHYGDNHRGVCMKFNTVMHGNVQELNLETEYGYSSAGPTIGMRPHRFREVKYHNMHQEIDFFRSIGRMTKMELNVFWYADENGNLSPCGGHLNQNENEWIDSYWNNYYNSLSIKLNEWSYEKEHRLIINGDFTDYSNKDKRKMKYDFKDLEGIIFGIKTPISDKIKIMKVVEHKCRKIGRKDFSFYQAYYSIEKGIIDKYKLNLIKFDTGQ
jgi:hypothetical protein